MIDDTMLGAAGEFDEDAVVPDGPFTARQEAALAALLQSPTIAPAAAAAGVPVRTVHRWLADKRFNAEFRRMRRETFRQAIALVQRYTPAAVQVLARVLADETAPHASKVSASSAILRFGRESIELDDLAERMRTSGRVRRPRWAGRRARPALRLTLTFSGAAPRASACPRRSPCLGSWRRRTLTPRPSVVCGQGGR